MSEAYDAMIRQLRDLNRELAIAISDEHHKMVMDYGVNQYSLGKTVGYQRGYSDGYSIAMQDREKTDDL